MDIYPAIDLLGGKAVRLTKGERESAKIYGEALDFAKFFQDCGANWIHIVDLDGAFSGSPKNFNLIEKIASSVGVKIQLGGGIIDEKTIKSYLNVGVNRLILGSIALKNIDFAKEMAKIYSIAIGIDSRDGLVATNGWLSENKINALDFASEFKDSEVEAIICTDINKDGLLSGINVDLSTKVSQNSGIYTIASGGFKDEGDLVRLKSAVGVGGVIIGKSFYEGNIDFKNLKFIF